MTVSDASAIVIAAYAVLGGGVIRYYWRRYLRFHPGRSIQYRLTDIWAAAIGMIPACLALGFGFERDTELIPWAAALFLAQLIGAFVGRIHGQLPPEPAHPSALRSAYSVVTGCTIGLIGGMLFYFDSLYGVPVLLVLTLAFALFCALVSRTSTKCDAQLQARQLRRK